MKEKRYKSWELYTCLALNRLARELAIDISQPNIEIILEKIFKNPVAGIPKAEISYEIKSNHQMTNKVLQRLEEDGLVAISKQDKKYQISITKQGVLYLRKFNTFFATIYKEQIYQHYRYQQLPNWFKNEEYQK